ncbi:sigma-54 dependent transcriptional regulator [bacterium]|nr:sigma-54 dependent transcriptional regulator [bacterium]MBU1026007.1 sigma-54 dependent transcriptional regulator [bacterium]
MAHKKLIYVVDDEDLVRWTLVETLKDTGYEVVSFENAEKMLEDFYTQPPHLILLDIQLPGISGLKALKKIKEDFPEQLVVMITAYGDVQTAVQCMQLGARDFVTKPFEIAELKLKVERFIDEIEVKGELRKHQSVLQKQFSFGNMIGNSPAMRKIWDIAKKVCEIPSSRVLITGESGTGKGQLARAIHYASPNSARRLIEVSCVNIPETLFESELFGYEPGAFTDARRQKIGLMEEADDGTLFLDEIGDMSPTLQGKLLKVIEEKSFTRLGGNRPISVELRLITATNKNLSHMVKEGRFREDLFYRLAVTNIHMPPLRERDDDVILLAKHFMEKLNEELHRDFKSIAPEVMNAMRAYPWPGNVRELMNTIERIMILETGPVINLSYLPPDIAEYAEMGAMKSVGLETLDQLERKHLMRALNMTEYNVSQAADILGINRTTILRKLEKWGMDIRDIRKQADDEGEEE